jgi:hypothetical protein
MRCTPASVRSGRFDRSRSDQCECLGWWQPQICTVSWRSRQHIESVLTGRLNPRGNCRNRMPQIRTNGDRTRRSLLQMEVRHVCTSRGFQDGWSWCRKCEGLYFGGNPTNGRCPAGGAHTNVGSGLYRLVLIGEGQVNWRWCRKCEGLFFFGSVNFGRCPAEPFTTRSAARITSWNRTRNSSRSANRQAGGGAASARGCSSGRISRMDAAHRGRARSETEWRLQPVAPLATQLQDASKLPGRAALRDAVRHLDPRARRTAPGRARGCRTT